MTLTVSDHFNGKTFFNPGAPERHGFGALLRWKLTSKPKAWPRAVAVESQPLPPAPTADGAVATWIGHSTVLLRTASHSILTDPILSSVAGPLSWLGARRTAPPALTLDAMPRVDTVVVSHDHFDHCDLPTLRALGGRDHPKFIAPLGHRALFAGSGIGPSTELDWWGSLATPDLTLTLVPALHWCRRAPGGTNRRLWGEFVLKAGGRTLYFAGDSGFREGLFTEIRKRCGEPDLAFLPIGAYEPRWFMSSAHMNPEEAVRAHQELGARKSVAIHWGAFQLTDEGMNEPVEALEAARSRAGLAAADFEALPIGASVRI